MKPIDVPVCALMLLFTAGASSSHAQSRPPAETDKERAQRQMNEQVLAAPFSVEDQAKIDAYVKSAMQKDLKPAPNAPTYWRRGYSCESIRGYGWRAYGDCSYYYRYHGRYWY